MLKRTFTRLYWRIGEVCQLTGISQQTLRAWEREFDQLRPRRDASGVRVYRERDFRLVLLLQTLVEKNGRSFSDVRQFLAENAERLEELLDQVDFDAVIDATAAAPSYAHVAEDISASGVLPHQPGDPLEEPEEPDPWDDAALAGLAVAATEAEGEPAEAPPPEPLNVRPERTEPPAGCAASSAPNEPLPPWVVAELIELRKELVALMQMIEAMAVSPPAHHDRPSSHEG